MRKAVIFDLDQTLVDSSSSEPLRKSRSWPSVYPMIPGFVLYDGWAEVFDFLRDNQIKTCIITTSPGTYARKVLTEFNIPNDHLLDYFSVGQRKPHPESFHKAIALFGCNCQVILSFGDRAIDIQASKAANIPSVGCTWGSSEIELLQASAPDYLIDKPIEIIPLLVAAIS